MNKWTSMSTAAAVLVLMAAGITGCGGGSDSSSGSATTVVTNGTLVVTNVVPVATLSGSWNGSQSGGGAFSLHLEQSGDAITGTITKGSSTYNISGSISGDTVSLTYTAVSAPPLSLTSIVTMTGNANSSRNNMSGNYVSSFLGVDTPGTWSANK